MHEHVVDGDAGAFRERVRVDGDVVRTDERRDVADRARPSAVGWWGVMDPFAFDVEHLAYGPGARRFEYGTPAVAATHGVVASARTNALGGNVVWLLDLERGMTLYYAHLDRHEVRTGERVERGDTLGRVGSTGNAEGNIPHLHFGIYVPGEGAIDPQPFVARPPGR